MQLKLLYFYEISTTKKTSYYFWNWGEIILRRPQYTLDCDVRTAWSAFLIATHFSHHFTIQVHAVQYDRDRCANCTRGANHQPHSADRLTLPCDALPPLFSEECLIVCSAAEEACWMTAHVSAKLGTMNQRAYKSNCLIPWWCDVINL